MIFHRHPNLFKLVVGQALLLVAFSVYTTVLMYLLVQQYHATAPILAVFGVLAAFPPALMVFLAPWLAHLQNNKQLLISLQMIATLILVLGGTLLLSRVNLVLIGLLYLVLSSVNVISASVEVGFIPVVFQENEAAIEQSVDFQYFVSTGLTIATSVLSSAILLLPGGSTGLLIASWISAPLGIIFYWLISYDATMQPTDSEINQGPTTEQSYLRQMRSALYKFTHTMPAFLIILFEAILGGMTGLLFELLPLTMKEIVLAVALFSTVGAIQKVGDLIGGAVAPLVKWPAPTFFAVDYIVSGGCFIGFTLPIPNVVRLILLLVAGIGMGMSGNVFEKLMYRSYNVGDISAMHALATSTFAFFSVTSYLAAGIKVSTLVLWQAVGGLTIVFGLIIVGLIIKEKH